MCFPFPLFIGQFFNHLFSLMSNFGQSRKIQSCQQNFSTHDANHSFREHCCNFVLATPPSLDHVLPFIFDYQLKHTFVLDRILFAQALTTTPHLSFGGQYGMVYEHLSRCFIPKNPFSPFSKLFQVVIAHGDILKLVALLLKANKLLAKSSSYCHRQSISLIY